MLLASSVSTKIALTIGKLFSITNVSVFRNDARNVIDNHSKTNHHHHYRQYQQLSNLGMTNRVTDSRTIFQKLHPNFGRTNCVTNSRTIFHRLHTILGITNCVSISRTICQRPRAIFRMTLFVLCQIV